MKVLKMCSGAVLDQTLFVHEHLRFVLELF